MAGRSLNKVMLIGNLTRDPQIRYTANNTAVASFGLATNRTWMPTDGGEKQDQVEFHNIVAWSKLAEVLAQWVHKGDRLYVEGRLQTQVWKNKEGHDQRTTEIVMENMIMLGGNRGGESAPAADMASDAASATSDAATAPAPTAKAKKSKSAKDEPMPANDDVSEVEDISEDIPF